MNLPPTSRSHAKPVVILVIDDDRERDKVYEDFFRKLSDDARSHFSIRARIPTSPQAALSELTGREAALVVLDLRLNEEWEKGSHNLYECIRKNKIPLAMLSMDFNDKVASERAGYVLRSLIMIYAGP
jgi:CheY-like chemotaxis protein